RPLFGGGRATTTATAGDDEGAGQRQDRDQQQCLRGLGFAHRLLRIGVIGPRSILGSPLGSPLSPYVKLARRVRARIAPALLALFLVGCGGGTTSSVT